MQLRTDICQRCNRASFVAPQPRTVTFRTCGRLSPRGHDRERESVTLTIRDGSASVRLTLRETGPAGTQAADDLGVDASVVGAAFSGRNDSVWIGRGEWTDFLAAMRALEGTPTGAEHIRSMSPHEFSLSVMATDRAGHMAGAGFEASRPRRLPNESDRALRQ